jgi:hypothetical protein
MSLNAGDVAGAAFMDAWGLEGVLQEVITTAIKSIAPRAHARIVTDNRKLAGAWR